MQNKKINKRYYIYIYILYISFKYYMKISFVFSRSTTNFSLTIEIFGFLHSELSDLLNNITDFALLPVLIAIVANFLKLVACINTLNIYVRIYENWSSIDHYLFYSSLFSMLLLIVEFLLVSVISGNIYDAVCIKCKNYI